MLKWTASAQRLNELPVRAPAPQQRRQRRQRRATIANKENVPELGHYTSTPMPMAPLQRQRNSPLVLAPLSDIRNVTPEPAVAAGSPRLAVASIRYAATLPRYEVEYSPTTTLLASGQQLALRGLLPLDPFLEQPRYMAATQRLRQRKLEADLLAETPPLVKPPPPAPRPVTPQPSTKMGDQTLDKLIDAILDSACKAEPSNKKKPRKSFNLRRRTLVKQQLESQTAAAALVLSPSYTPADDPASDLSFGLHPLPPTPEPATPASKLRHSQLVQLPTPAPAPAPATSSHSDTFCLETPVRPLKRSRTQPAVSVESPLKRFKVDARNYFEVGLALPSSIYV
ncbi:CG12496 [Drosophila busckii]|uniref:CG12496 n=1 Tax=Drosophila busckii TaxID=30019 RepID=A0A0M4F7U8_DROBS|nr:uncharacterized protein LOC108606198 [Drosophila busckii]ALC48337.1 CG12496 [Drosophila busckii]